MKIKNYFLAFLFLVLGFGCASKNKLVENYPLSEVSRPYTLPDNVDSWNTVMRVFEGVTPIYPLVWEMSLSDDFSLIWMPLPLGFKWQLHNDETHRFGVSALYLILAGVADVDYRYKINDSWAFDVNYDRMSGEYLVANIDMTTVSAGPVYQFTDRFAAKVSLSKVTGRLSAGILTKAVITSFGIVPSNDSIGFTGTGGGLDLFYSFNYQWNLKAGVSLLNIDNVGNATTGNVVLSHLWD